jgi:hypothetical protein
LLFSHPQADRSSDSILASSLALMPVWASVEA